MSKSSLVSKLGIILVAATTLLPIESCRKEYDSKTLERFVQSQLQLITEYKTNPIQENNSGGIFQEGDIINYIPKLKWNLNKLEKIDILDTNPLDGARFTPDEIGYIRQFFNNIRVDGKKLYIHLNTKGISNSLNKLFLDNGAITIVPTKFLNLDGRVGDAQVLDSDEDKYLDSGIIRLKEEKVNPLLLHHELRHLFISNEEPTPEEQKELLSLADIAERWIKK